MDDDAHPGIPWNVNSNRLFFVFSLSCHSFFFLSSVILSFFSLLSFFLFFYSLSFFFLFPWSFSSWFPTSFKRQAWTWPATFLLSFWKKKFLSLSFISNFQRPEGSNFSSLFLPSFSGLFPMWFIDLCHLLRDTISILLFRVSQE